MDDNQKQENIEDKKLEKQKEEVQKEFKGFFQSLKEFFPQLLNIRKGTDKEATAQIIKEGISMRGHTAWILVFSILIASIGLNVSSTAVVIGAMLISPLMGPILGIGFSIGINDVDTLKASIINFGVMVALSILTSFIFFSIPIFQEATPELLARTKPDVRDVLIAVAGGLALIIAISRPRPQFNTVAGVAIATALMPPLSTAGFGLATGNFRYFGGALFLFTINSIFIALAAFSITKYLRFPMLKYINQAKRRRISRIASMIALVIFSFSIYLFYQLFLENQFTTRAKRFIASIRDEGVNIIGDEKESIDYKENEIKLYVFGNQYDQMDMDRWNLSLDELGLKNTKLTILQSQNDSGIRDDIDKIKELYINGYKLINAKDETIKEKDQRIVELEKDLRKYYDNDILFNQVIKEIKINYDDLKQISFAREYVTNFKKIDTVSIISVKWKTKVKKKDQIDQEKKLKKWMETRLKIEKIEIRQLQ
jgi:uncharacterized hydrophobic protein (TIGR00271 family)